jgi:hypothetical protein
MSANTNIALRSQHVGTENNDNNNTENSSGGDNSLGTESAAAALAAERLEKTIENLSLQDPIIEPLDFIFSAENLVEIARRRAALPPVYNRNVDRFSRLSEKLIVLDEHMTRDTAKEFNNMCWNELQQTFSPKQVITPSGQKFLDRHFKAKYASLSLTKEQVMDFEWLNLPAKDFAFINILKADTNLQTVSSQITF